MSPWRDVIDWPIGSPSRGGRGDCRVTDMSFGAFSHSPSTVSHIGGFGGCQRERSEARGRRRRAGRRPPLGHPHDRRRAVAMSRALGESAPFSVVGHMLAIQAEGLVAGDKRERR